VSQDLLMDVVFTAPTEAGTEVVAQAQQSRFSAEYKLRIRTNVLRGPPYMCVPVCPYLSPRQVRLLCISDQCSRAATGRH